MEKIINNIEKVNKLLAEYKGANARIWSFNRFHEKIELLIDFPDYVGNEYAIFITLFSCNYFKGDLYWLNSELKISSLERMGHYNTIIRLKDLKSGSYIDCLSGFILEKGLESEFPEKFSTDGLDMI